MACVGKKIRNWNLVNGNQRESRGAKLLPTLETWSGIVLQIKRWTIKRRNWIHVFKKKGKKGKHELLISADWFLLPMTLVK